MVETLAADGRAVRVDFPSGPRWIAGEDGEIYGSLDTESSAQAVISRFLRSRGPVTTDEIADRFGDAPERVERIATTLLDKREIIRGRFRTGGDEGASSPGEWCARPTVEQMHKKTIAILRREITPSSPSEFTSFLHRWQGVCSGKPEHAADLSSTLLRLQAIPLPAETWERDILRARVPGFSSDMLSSVTAAGNGVWVGNASGRIRFLFRGNGSLFLPPEDRPTDYLREAARRILEFLHSHGASFFSDIRDGSRLSLAAMNNGIAQLFWEGLITNDLFSELTAVKRLMRDEEGEIEPVQLLNPRHAPARARIMQSARRALRQVPGWAGRWSVLRTPGVMGPVSALDQAAEGQARQMLERYGIVAREFHRREELSPWPVIASQLQRMEMRGEIRRGYFVQGLSGMQWALPEAVDALRRAREAHEYCDDPILLNGCDPANPYGTGIDLAGPAGVPVRFTRNAGTYVAFSGGSPVLVIESYGARLRTVGAPDHTVVRDALSRFVDLLRLPVNVRPFTQITVEYCDELRPGQSPLAPVLRSLGFVGDMNQTMRRDAYV
jgi:ATP-dependent Lhr-like helicase